MKVELLEGYYGTLDTNGQHWQAGEQHEVSDGLAGYLFTHHKATAVDKPAQELAAQVEADAQAARDAAAAAPDADTPLIAALKVQLAAAVALAAELRTRVVAEIAKELRAQADAKAAAEAQQRLVAEAEAQLREAEAPEPVLTKTRKGNSKAE